MPTSQSQIQRTEIENQIKNDFSQLQQKLGNLKNEVQTEVDEIKKKEKETEIQRMESDLAEMRNLIDRLSSLQDEDLQTLKTKLESYSQVRQDVQGEVTDLQKEKTPTPTTYELLKGSETSQRLLKIISSNPQEFKNIPGNTAEQKLEYIFSKIHNSLALFMKNKLGNNENYDNIINNTITPAFEWNMMELLRDQGNETNISMLKGIDSISRDSFSKLVNGVSDFAKKTRGSFDKFSQWVNAVDYLSVHNGVLRNPTKSEVLTNPLEFKNYLNNPIFANDKFSPYELIDQNIFKVDENQTFEFGMSLQEKQLVLDQIGNIQVVNNPKTTALIANMLDKPEKFLGVVPDLQNTANHLLDGLNAINPITKVIGIDIIGEVSKPPEHRSFLYKIVDFICKLIGITGGIEGIVKKWRLGRLELSDDKNENISLIFTEYQKLAGKGNEVTITDVNSCSSALADFALTDLDKQSTSKGDYLRDVMANNMDINLLTPSVVQETLGNDYLKKEIVTVDGKQQEKIVVDVSKITEEEKRKLAHLHIANMKTYLENYNNLKDFYPNIHNTDDLVICMTSSLYADKDDIIEGIKAKVFLPENYGVVHELGGSNNPDNGSNNPEQGATSLSDLTQAEKSEMDNLVEQSKTPNTINYLENSTYKKYLNLIERDLNLPKYALECVCYQESTGELYDGNSIKGSKKGAQGLFQFIPGTADQYMKHSKLQEKYGKTFNSRNDFLRDPLATAWAAGIMLAEFMKKYDFQSSLACYNCGPVNYKEKVGDRNLTSEDLKKLSKETMDYVQEVTQNILSHNSAQTSDIFADLGKYSWAQGSIDGSSIA